MGRQSGTFYLENVDNSAESFHNKQIGLGKSDTRAGLIESGALADKILLWTWLKDFFLFDNSWPVFSSTWDFDNRVAVGYNGKYQDLTSLRNYSFPAC